MNYDMKDHRTFEEYIESLPCPHCSAPIESGVIRSMFGRVTSGLRKTHGGKQKVLRPCRWCEAQFGAKEMQLHLPACPKKPVLLKKEGGADHRGRDPILRECQHCGAMFPTVELSVHRRGCFEQKAALAQAQRTPVAQRA